MPGGQQTISSERDLLAQARERAGRLCQAIEEHSSDLSRRIEIGLLTPGEADLLEGAGLLAGALESASRLNDSLAAALHAFEAVESPLAPDEQPPP